MNRSEDLVWTVDVDVVIFDLFRGLCWRGVGRCRGGEVASTEVGKLARAGCSLTGDRNIGRLMDGMLCINSYRVSAGVY